VLTESVSATVKEFRYDVQLGDDDDGEDDELALVGSAITLNLKDCHAGREKVSKKQVSYTEQTIGLAAGEPFGLHGRLWVSFMSPEDVFLLKMQDVLRLQDDEPRRQGELIALLVFGRAIAARVCQVELQHDRALVEVELLGNRSVTIPDDPALRAISLFRNVIVRLSLGSRDFSYHRATIDFDRLPA